MLVVDITATEPGGTRLGRYKVVERRQDGSLLLAPESVSEIVDEVAERPLSSEAFLDALERLDTAAAQLPAR